MGPRAHPCVSRKQSLSERSDTCVAERQRGGDARRLRSPQDMLEEGVNNREDIPAHVAGQPDEIHLVIHVSRLCPGGGGVAQFALRAAESEAAGGKPEASPPTVVPVPPARPLVSHAFAALRCQLSSASTMGEAKADELVAKAEKKLKGFQLFGNKNEEALEMFEKAVNAYKLDKKCETARAVAF